MALEDPYHEDDDDDGSDEDSDEEDEQDEVQARRKKAKGIKKEKLMHVDIDMALSAYANSRALYEAKKKATDKASKTVQGTSLFPPGEAFGRGRGRNEDGMTGTAPLFCLACAHLPQILPHIYTHPIPSSQQSFQCRDGEGPEGSGAAGGGVPEQAADEAVLVVHPQAPLVRKVQLVHHLRQLPRRQVSRHQERTREGRAGESREYEFTLCQACC